MGLRLFSPFFQELVLGWGGLEVIFFHFFSPFRKGVGRYVLGRVEDFFPLSIRWHGEEGGLVVSNEEMDQGLLKYVKLLGK
jgi:hypothetical protein